MNVFRKMLTPKEVKQALAALNLAETEFSPLDEYALVKQWVEQRILTEQERVIHSIVVDELTPKNLVFLLIANVTADHLSSGEYHVHRGALDFVGESLVRIFDTASDKLVAGDYHSQEDAEKGKDWIREQIEGVG